MHISHTHNTRVTRDCTRFTHIYIAKHVSHAYAHVRIIHLYLQMSCSKMRTHTSSESICRIFSSRISSSFPVLHNTINMPLRQQSGIVRLKYTLHAYMHKLCAREIHVTAIHYCAHINLAHIFVRVWHANHSHFETLYLASYRYCIHMYMFMYKWNCSLIVVSLTLLLS